MAIHTIQLTYHINAPHRKVIAKDRHCGQFGQFNREYFMPDQTDEALVFAILIATASPAVRASILEQLEGQCELEPPSEP